jgi:hypothetical protein
MQKRTVALAAPKSSDKAKVRLHDARPMDRKSLEEQFRVAKAHVALDSDNIGRQRALTSSMERTGQDATRANALLRELVELQPGGPDPCQRSFRQPSVVHAASARTGQFAELLWCRHSAAPSTYNGQRMGAGCRISWGPTRQRELCPPSRKRRRLFGFGLSAGFHVILLRDSVTSRDCHASSRRQRAEKRDVT